MSADVGSAVAEGSELRRAVLGVLLGAALGLIVRVLARPERGRAS